MHNMSPLNKGYSTSQCFWVTSVNSLDFLENDASEIQV